jgi:hypothetical protein
MVTISPLTEVALRHRAFRVVVSDSGQVAVLSGLGSGSLISPDFGSMTPFAFSLEFKGAALSPDGSLLAITAANGITFLSTSTFKKIHRLSGSFQSCHFDSRNRLWTCARFSRETVVEVWELGTWRRIANAKITDPYYGDSYFGLLPHPDQNCVVVWAAQERRRIRSKVGQHGQCLFWACLGNDGINVIRFPELHKTTWPSFSPNGDEFLVISEGELHRYGYPRGPLHARMQGLRESEDDNLGDFVYYADAGHALVTSLNYRLFLVDVEKMEIEDEIAILGHEPRPVSELDPVLNPGLKGDRGLASDMVFLLPLPGARFVSVHSEFRGVHPEDRDDRLLTWQLPATL